MIHGIQLPVSEISHARTSMSARVLKGQAAARMRGVTWGGSRKGRQLSVTDEQKAQVLSMRGEKIARIARNVSLSRPTVYRLLRDALVVFDFKAAASPQEIQFKIREDRNRRRRAERDRKRRESISNAFFGNKQTEVQKKNNKYRSTVAKNALLALRITLINQTKEENKCQQH